MNVTELNQKLRLLASISCCVLVCWFVICLQTKAEQLPIKIYTSADGLGSSFVDYMTRDSHGFLWFCTRDGVSRFDGVSFTTYLVGNEEEGIATGIEDMLESRQGNYFFVTKRGLFRYDPKTVPLSAKTATDGAGRVRLNAELISKTIGLLYEDLDGYLWYYSGSRIFHIEEADGKATLQPSKFVLPADVKPPVIRVIYQSEDKSHWLSSTTGLFRRLPDGRVLHFSTYPLTVSYTGTDQILGDKDGRIWLGHLTGLFIINPEPLSNLNSYGQYTKSDLAASRTIQIKGNEPVLQPDKPGDVFHYTDINGIKGIDINRFYQTSDGNMWITTAKGLVEFDGKFFSSYTAKQGLPSNLSGSMVEDLHGNLWISGRSGAARLERNGLISFDTYDGLGATGIYSIYENRQGDLFVVNGLWFISRFDGKGFRTIKLPLPNDERPLWTSNAAFLDSQNGWWALTNKKLYRFAPTNNFEQLDSQRPLASYDSSNGLPGNLIYRMFEDSHGNLWISTNETAYNGLVRWNRAEEKFQNFTEADGFVIGRAASSFAEDKHGHLWFGFYNGNAARYTNGRFTNFTVKDGLPAGFITALHIDQKDRLWIASSLGGLARVDDTNAAQPSFVYYTVENGLSSNNIRSITEDAQGRIYIGTARSVDRITPDTGQVKHYTINNGLPADMAGSAFRDKNGVLWFGTADGLARLVPEQDKTPTVSPIWFSGIRIAGESQPLAQLGSTEVSNLELTSAQNNLQIDFFGLDFSPSASLRYQYKLEGADSEWSVPTAQRTVSYPNLSAGTYRFLVRAVNAAGVPSNEPASVSFRILPPIWKRWWFIALSLLLVGFVAFAFIRSRLGSIKALQREREERLRELERVRTRIATDLHDDIGSSLTQIAVLSEVVRQGTSNNNNNGSRVVEPLQRISAVSNELVDTMSDIVWAINPHKDHLSDLSQRMRRFASDVFAAKEITFHFQTPDLKTDAHLGANIRREVFLIFKESVNNVVKHANCTNVEIAFKVKDSWLTLNIKDNGNGFDVLSFNNNGHVTTNSKGGNGLPSMKRRAEELGGDYIIESIQGEGTMITLRVPLILQTNGATR